MCEITKNDIRMLLIGVKGTSCFVKICQVRTKVYVSKYFSYVEGKKHLKKDTETMSCLKQPTRELSNLLFLLVVNHTSEA